MENPSIHWNFPVVTAHIDESGSGGWQSIRTQRYRYIKYIKTGDEELYDHSKDPNEWINLIDSSAYVSVRGKLSELVPDKMTPLGSWKAPNDSVAKYNQSNAY